MAQTGTASGRSSREPTAVLADTRVLRVLEVHPALAYIAVQALAVTFLGLSFGRRIGAQLGERAELVSGVVLTLLGIGIAVNAATGRHLL